MDFEQFMSYQKKSESENGSSSPNEQPSFHNRGSSPTSARFFGKNAPLRLDTGIRMPTNVPDDSLDAAEKMFLSPLSDEAPDIFSVGSHLTTPKITIEPTVEVAGNYNQNEGMLPSRETEGAGPGVFMQFLTSQQQEPYAEQTTYVPPPNRENTRSRLLPNFNEDSISERSPSVHSVYSAASFNDNGPGTWQLQDMALSPAPSRLTTGDDELDEILSINSTNEPFYDAEYGPSNIAVPNSDNFLDPVGNVFEGDGSVYFGQSDPLQRSPNVPARDFLKPQISIEEFKALSPAETVRHRQFSNASSPMSFHTARQNTDFLSVQADDPALTSEDERSIHDMMRQGRKIRRRSTQLSRRLSASSRSLSADEKARSLSEDREKLMALAALKPYKSHNDHFGTYADSEGVDSEKSPSSDTLNLVRRKSSQKNPAVYACHVCDKKFTRPYNLKSHLKTHTDERPFVCSICGKAFARQHDRKRHEDLHSGKKRYICQGNLKDGSQWGCGKKFARSDALGRHFKTEGGKRCIAPLYEEVSRERAAGRETDLDLPVDF
ncbi:LADA_0E11386g1_1 [Lachancea dasiensis]|uniref:LADA_0E11386g1_1 n=1 Tax=Lachancea dasiensis TaxID=1072105 RepID=A0A1G4JEK2_9SACH|nr:LADA_0E11386g1_1 [Lachancea dasiensis]